MPQSPVKADNLELVFSRIKVGAFMAVVCGLLITTLASTFGEEGMRTIILGTLTIVFVIGGGLLGLVTMHHISHTHLPETIEEEQTEAPFNVGEQAARRRSRGFLGMFSLNQDASDENGPNTDYRRTA